MQANISETEKSKRQQKLLSVLDRSKATMDAAETGNFKAGNLAINEGEEFFNVSVNEEKKPVAPRRTLKNAETTKLPKAIVESFINNPVPAVSFGGGGFDIPTETIKRVRQLNERMDDEDEIFSSARDFSTQRLKERVKDKTDSNINQDQLYRMIREIVEEVVTEVFDKRVIKEEIQLKVGDTIFSGNLSPLPKVKKK